MIAKTLGSILLFLKVASQKVELSLAPKNEKFLPRQFRLVGDLPVGSYFRLNQIAYKKTSPDNPTHPEYHWQTFSIGESPANRLDCILKPWTVVELLMLPLD